MDQVQFQYVPRVLVMNKDQWVSFPNSDDVRHHVCSFSEPQRFEIKIFKGSESVPIQFNKEGIAARLSGAEFLWIPESPLSEISLDNIKRKLEQKVVKDDVSTPIPPSIG